MINDYLKLTDNSATISHPRLLCNNKHGAFTVRILN